MRGNGRVFQRGSIWWIAYYHEGRERRESSGSRERKEALRLLRQRIGEIAVGASQMPQPKRVRMPGRLMKDLFDLVQQHWRLKQCSSEANLAYLKRLRRRFARYPVRACTTTAINHYMDAMLQAGRKPPTINREITVLRSALRLGYQHDLVPRLPIIKLLPDYSVRDEYFTRSEINLMIPHLSDNMRDLVLFAFLTGWRQGEIIDLEWANVNRTTGVIRLRPEQNKNRTVRVLALQGELVALIDRRWQARKTGNRLASHVFHRGGRPLTRTDIRPEWQTACERAGLGHRWFHSLRRSAARNMSLEGVPEKVIMSIMGHKTRTMFDRYNIVTEADQRAYGERLFRPQHGQ